MKIEEYEVKARTKKKVKKFKDKSLARVAIARKYINKRRDEK